MNLPKKVSILLVFLIVTSCAENLDFNQIEDYKLKPVITSALTFFTVQPFQFFDQNGIQQNSKTDVVEFELFQDEFIQDNVVKMVFNAEFKNEFDRDVSIKVDLLDINDLEVHSFDLIFVESEDVNPPPFEDEIVLVDNPIIFTAVKAKITASLEDTGVQMNPFDTSKFEFKSSFTLFIESEI